MRCLSVKCEFHNGMKYEVVRKDSRCLSLLTQSPSSVVCLRGLSLPSRAAWKATNNCGQWPTRSGAIWVGDLRDLSEVTSDQGAVFFPLSILAIMGVQSGGRGDVSPPPVEKSARDTPATTPPQKLGYFIIFFLTRMAILHFPTFSK